VQFKGKGAGDFGFGEAFYRREVLSLKREGEVPMMQEKGCIGKKG